MSKPSKKRRDEPWIVFLDIGFAKRGLAETLTEAGFDVRRYRDHFKTADGKPQNSVKDPSIIKFCNSRKWMLLTTDSNMERTHIEDIKKTEIAILATARNNPPQMEEYVDALIKLKPKIERLYRKNKGPWFATFTLQAKIGKFHPITADHYTRRDRPKEGQAKSKAPRAAAAPSG